MFKLPRYRVFDYTPMYAKEKQEKRLFANNNSEIDGGPGSHIKGQMANYIKSAKRIQRNSNIRLAVIVIFLTLVSVGIMKMFDIINLFVR